MTTPIDDLPTIDTMIASLGAPRNYAEQALLAKLREQAARHAALLTQMTDPALRWRHGFVRARANGEWASAYATVSTIEAFREHGHKPVMPGVYGIPAIEKAAH